MTSFQYAHARTAEQSRDVLEVSAEPGGDRPVVLDWFKNTNDVTLHTHASTNSVRRDASRRASPDAPAVLSGRTPQGGEFVALLFICLSYSKLSERLLEEHE